MLRLDKKCHTKIVILTRIVLDVEDSVVFLFSFIGILVTSNYSKKLYSLNNKYIRIINMA